MAPQALFGRQPGIAIERRPVCWGRSDDCGVARYYPEGDRYLLDRLRIRRSASGWRPLPTPGVREADSGAAEALRDLVEKVTVFRDPSKPGGVQIEVAGRLNALLGEEAYPNRVRGVRGKMVAEV